MSETSHWEVIVVGAGPAGLTAALYPARYRHRVLVLHDETARALRIPRTHNVPGFSQGVAGTELIARMTDHALHYGARVVQRRIAAAERRGNRFLLSSDDGVQWNSRALILATGLHLNQIALDAVAHQAAIDAGALRYCPICDGFEHTAQRIAVVGCDTQGAGEALFLRRFSNDVTLIPKAYDELSAAERERLKRAGITLIISPAVGFALEDGKMRVETADGQSPIFDVVYPALGVRPRTELAEALGILPDAQGCLPADAPLKTAIAGVYSAGDVVEGLDQICV
ncbi:MAG: NAD(P)/FAD-dependent oxidoreductase, partial [Novosphingobium sp.]